MELSRTRVLHHCKKVSKNTNSALEALSDYALYKSTFTLHYITIGKHTRSTKWDHFQLPRVTSDPDFKNVNRKSHVLHRTVTISNDLDGPLARFSWSRHFEVEYLKKWCILGTKSY